MNFKKWCVSKVKHIVTKKNVDTTAGLYPVIGYKAVKKFRTQKDAREFRKTYTGKDRIQIVNTVRSAVSR